MKEQRGQRGSEGRLGEWNGERACEDCAISLSIFALAREDEVEEERVLNEGKNRFLFFCRFLVCFFLSLLNLVSLLLLPAARGGEPDRARQSPRLSLRGSDKENESRRENRRRRMEGGNQEAIVEADAANARGGGGAAPAPAPTPSLVVSDEAIATLVALTGGDEASARALLEVEKRRTITKTRKKGRLVVCCLLAQPPLSLSFSPSKTTNRPPPATSSKPPTSSWRAAYPP